VNSGVSLIALLNNHLKDRDVWKYRASHQEQVLVQPATTQNGGSNESNGELFHRPSKPNVAKCASAGAPIGLAEVLTPNPGDMDEKSVFRGAVSEGIRPWQQILLPIFKIV
jgi:hypothetical protein